MIYLDNHSTTPCDPRVVEAMLPWLSTAFGNPHSGHSAGQQAAEAIEQAIAEIAGMLGARSDAIVITSGATESTNLALRGVCTHPRQKRRHVVSVSSEHPAVGDVLRDLAGEGFRVSWVPLIAAGHRDAGIVDLDRLAAAIDDDTAVVSVMWANNEIGAIAPMRQIADLAHQHGALLHSDATQAVGRLPVDVLAADVDLLSASAHKFYGPKGVGLLVAGNANRRVRLRPQIVGGGQQRGIRSGTMNPAAIVAMATALRLCVESMDQQRQLIAALRDRLWQRLVAGIDELQLNGPALADGDVNRFPADDRRLAGNLNVMLPKIEGQAWMSAAPEIAFSSGSACSHTDPTPSHVLMALGLSESQARRSVRFGLGRFNTTDQINTAAEVLIDAYHRVSRLTG